MRFKKNLFPVALVLSTLLALTGCTQNQQVVFDAAMNMQNVQSMQAHTTMTFKLSGSGFEPTIQEQVDEAAKYLNDAKLDIDVKTSANEEKTVSQSQVDMNLLLEGMNINVPIWVDTDLTGDTPKVSEIIKLPLIAKKSMPMKLASKEYMVMDSSDMMDSELGNFNIKKLTEFGKGFQAAQVAFLTSYAERFNPDVEVLSTGKQTVQTKYGPKKAEIFEIKLSDVQFKDFIRYTVNNFAQDPEAMNFVKENMKSFIEVSSVPDQEKVLSDFDQAFDDFDANKPQFLAKFNSAMDQLKDVTILGDKGLEIKYAISEGSCVQESGTINLEINMAQMEKFVNTLSGQQSKSEDAKGTLGLQIKFDSDITTLDSPLEIDIPEVNSENSFNYMDLMKGLPSLDSKGKVNLEGKDCTQDD